MNSKYKPTLGDTVAGYFFAILWVGTTGSVVAVVLHLVLLLAGKGGLFE